jgi:signal peptidase I
MDSQDPGDSKRSRSRWFAGVMTLLLPGMGQLYAGRWIRAAAFYLGELPVGCVALQIAMQLRCARWNLAAAAAVLLAYRAWAVVDAIRVTRTAPPAMRWFLGEGLCVILLVCNSWIVVVATTPISDHVTEAFVVPTSSMADTVLAGDRMLIDKLFFTRPARRDVIVYRHVEDDGEPYNFLKRVIGLPGETVEIRQGLVFVDGVAMDEPYVSQERRQKEDFGPVRVPESCYFVLGDARSSSRDSRRESHGFVAADKIRGRVMVIWASQDFRTREIRWSRIGTVVR